MKRYGLTVKRTINHHFVIEARSGAEAAMKLGQMIAENPDAFADNGVEIDRRMMSPEMVSDGTQLTFDDAVPSLSDGQSPE